MGNINLFLMRPDTFRVNASPVFGLETFNARIKKQSTRIGQSQKNDLIMLLILPNSNTYSVFEMQMSLFWGNDLVRSCCFHLIQIIRDIEKEMLCLLSLKQH